MRTPLEAIGIFSEKFAKDDPDFGTIRGVAKAISGVSYAWDDGIANNLDLLALVAYVLEYLNRSQESFKEKVEPDVQ